jgi:outer membrane protein OmpA-like peptidoglycan-associated protein
MKRFIFFACVCASLSCAIPLAVMAQNLDPYPNYVVIGAFAHHKNAVHFTKDANRLNFPARFEMNPNRNLYYVYVLTTDDREYAFSEALKLRFDTKYFDTWVFCGLLGEAALRTLGPEVQDLNPQTGKKMDRVNVDQNTTSPGQNAGIKDQPREGLSRQNGPVREGATAELRDASEDVEPMTGKSDRLSSSDQTNVNTAQPGSKEETAKQTVPPREFPKKVNTVPLTPEEVVGKNFYFQLSRADNGQWVEGEVDAIDFEKSRKMATYQANAPVTVILPAGKSKRISFVCQVFGYRKQQIEFDPANPSPDLFLDEKGNLVVPFELVRLQKGDIAIMYNVFFFKDAAVMRPESRYEVNNLLDLLNENPEYNIKIHGHTNGNASGKIIRMDNTENFYSLSNTKQGFGSAKKLSEERALVIKQFLVSSGISEGRMLIKAWGGKKPIHDKHSVRAVENVRVEIEILSD